MLSSQGLVFATAMAVSAGTVILFDLFRDKYYPGHHNQDSSSPENPRILRSCLASGEKKRKKEKKVSFAEGVKESIRKGEEYRRGFRKVNRRSCGGVVNRGMPANHAALYTGVLKDRSLRLEYSY
ncbi:unnamed protein product [Cuscuta epithymum]|uniref:Uncharacterized protein n=1 Tax=Cuscuta epithymum TaxID=186058 RepID=A0AAV0CFB8_9ASTE|nr:unnamed protein product [Cuscuta epithymum]CAH9141454.1 unnamed protein product [Cuscuta epithymum]